MRNVATDCPVSIQSLTESRSSGENVDVAYTTDGAERLLRPRGAGDHPAAGHHESSVIPPHASADELTDDGRAVIGSISRQAVYDSLGVLVDKNLVRRIQPASRTFDIDCAVGAVPCLTADDDHGFEIDEAEVIY